MRMRDLDFWSVMLVRLLSISDAQNICDQPQSAALRAAVPFFDSSEMGLSCLMGSDQPDQLHISGNRVMR